MTSKDVPTITHLPFEVLEVITNFSPIPSQLSIARVSRLFYLLALRALYHAISLPSPTTVIACCRTLISNRDAASIVRSFEISYTYYSPSSNIFLAAYYFLLEKALLSLGELHTLKLLVHDPHFIRPLSRSSFPMLHHFECYLTPSRELIEFLNRHSKINYLQLSPHEDAIQPFMTQDKDGSGVDRLHSIELPELQYYVGNVQGITHIGSSSRLRAAIINWNAVDTDPDSAFQSLQSSSRDSLTVLSCVRRSWNLDLIQSISMLLPDILFLNISNIMLVDSFPAEEYLQHVQTCLARFTKLRRIQIDCVDYWELGNLSSSVDKDFATVTAWGSVCSTLAEISLPHSSGLLWFKISDTTWVPDPEHDIGKGWIHDILRSKRHPIWRSIVELANMEMTAAEDSSHRHASENDSFTVTMRRLREILQEVENENARSLVSAGEGIH